MDVHVRVEYWGGRWDVIGGGPPGFTVSSHPTLVEAIDAATAYVRAALQKQAPAP